MDQATACVVCLGEDLKSSPATVTSFIAERVFGRSAFTTTLFTCQCCGLGFYKIRYSDDELSALYHGYRDERYQKQRHKFEPWYTEQLNHSFQDNAMLQVRKQSLLDLMERYEGGIARRLKNLLDYGGDDGKLVHGILENVDRYVYDISGVSVKEGLKKADEESFKTFDFVLCSNVLEHTPYPHKLMDSIEKFCHDGTVVYLEVPFERPYSFDTLKKRVAQQIFLLLLRPTIFMATLGPGMFAHLHEHVNYFSVQSMKRLFNDRQFVNVSVFVEEINGYPYVCGFATEQS